MPLDSEGTIEVDPEFDNVADAVMRFFFEHCIFSVDDKSKDSLVNQVWMIVNAVCSGVGSSQRPEMIQFGFKKLETNPSRYALYSPRVLRNLVHWVFGRGDAITLSPESRLVKEALPMGGILYLTAGPKLLTFGDDVVWQAQG
jgi:hypothetical protein